MRRDEAPRSDLSNGRGAAFEDVSRSSPSLSEICFSGQWLNSAGTGAVAHRGARGLSSANVASGTVSGD